MRTLQPRHLALLAGLLGAAPAAHAQALLPAPGTTTRHRTWAGLGVEPHLTTSLGYVQGLGPAEQPERYQLGAGLYVAPLILGQHQAWRINAVASAHWHLSGRWELGATAMPYLVHDRNTAAEVHGLGLELRVQPALRYTRWTLALDTGWQVGLLTHVRHQAFSRRAFADRYPDGVQGTAGPRDGWYGLTAQRYRLGVAAAWPLSPAMQLHGALGSRFNRQRQGVLFSFDLGQIPVYAEAGLSLRW